MFQKHLRRTIMRYVNLSSILALRLIAVKVHERFPTYESLVEAKLLLPAEVIDTNICRTVIPISN